jgi:hypothetical protein
LLAYHVGQATQVTVITTITKKNLTIITSIKNYFNGIETVTSKKARRKL